MGMHPAQKFPGILCNLDKKNNIFEIPARILGLDENGKVIFHL